MIDLWRGMVTLRPIFWWGYHERVRCSRRMDDRELARWNVESALLKLCLFEEDVLFSLLVVFHHFKLAGARSAVFGSRVEYAGTLGALKLDLLALCFSHDVNLLDISLFCAAE